MHYYVTTAVDNTDSAQFRADSFFAVFAHQSKLDESDVFKETLLTLKKMFSLHFYID